MLIAGANKARTFDELREWARNEKVWRVSYKNNPSDDDHSGGGWCGYLAYDQIRRKSPRWADIKDPRDIKT